MAMYEIIDGELWRKEYEGPQGILPANLLHGPMVTVRAEEGREFFQVRATRLKHFLLTKKWVQEDDRPQSPPKTHGLDPGPSRFWDDFHTHFPGYPKTVTSSLN